MKFNYSSQICMIRKCIHCATHKPVTSKKDRKASATACCTCRHLDQFRLHKEKDRHFHPNCLNHWVRINHVFLCNSLGTWRIPTHPPAHALRACKIHLCAAHARACSPSRIPAHAPRIPPAHTNAHAPHSTFADFSVVEFMKFEEVLWACGAGGVRRVSEVDWAGGVRGMFAGFAEFMKFEGILWACGVGGARRVSAVHGACGVRGVCRVCGVHEV